MKRQTKTYFFHAASATCAFLLLGMGKVYGASPFALGLFAGLTYAGWNVFALAPAYLLASVVLNPGTNGVLLGLMPAVIMIAACVVKRAAHARVTVVDVTLCAALSAVMRFLVEPLPVPDALVTVALTVGAAYSSVIALYATLVRGVGYRLSADEKVCLAILLGALTYGAFCCNVGEITPYYLLSAVALLVAVFAFDEGGVTFALAMGVAGTTAASTCALVASFVACLTFKKHSRLLAAMSVPVTDTLVACLTGTAGVVRVASVTLGALAFLLVPKAKMARVLNYFGTFGESHAVRSLVNRNRSDIRQRSRALRERSTLQRGLQASRTTCARLT